MTAGGAPGLEFGPFTQNIARLKKRSTTLLTDTVTPDVDLVWSRKNKLVEGFYQMSGRVIVEALDVGVTSINFQWQFGQANPADAIFTLTGAVSNLDSATPINKAWKVFAWEGDGDAIGNGLVDAPPDRMNFNFSGVMFIPTPTDLAFAWAPDAVTPLGAQMNAASIIRLALVR